MIWSMRYSRWSVSKSQMGPVCPTSSRGTIGTKEINELKYHSQISESARSALFAKAASESEKIEMKVLERFDKFKEQKQKEGAGGGDPLLPALCMRRLALYYRRIMKRYTEFGEVAKCRREHAGQMYKILCINFSHIFTGVLHAFDRTWNPEDHLEELGNDRGLIQLLNEVKIAEEHHYKSDLKLDEDVVYKSFAKKTNKHHWSLDKQWQGGSPVTPPSPSMRHPSTRFVVWDRRVEAKEPQKDVDMALGHEDAGTPELQETTRPKQKSQCPTSESETTAPIQPAGLSSNPGESKSNGEACDGSEASTGRANTTQQNQGGKEDEKERAHRILKKVLIDNCKYFLYT
ncbi:hypothetical protein F5B19DRAFT_333122 [Rostrohypoxylon terebratum]|nr:hypothetical protein F5B19DRAFT_333122 [Rostrohypoxylon terebratum]